MMTLREALDLVPDFRSSQGRRHSLGAILALATCAIAAPAAYAIAQWGRDQGGATAQLSQEKTPCVANRVFKGTWPFEALANSGVEAPPVPGRENLVHGQG